MYPESFKQQVVQEYEAGGVSLQALRRKYRIGGTTTVSKWLHRYGRGVEMVSSKSPQIHLRSPLRKRWAQSHGSQRSKPRWPTCARR
jgi:transposase-like protein